MKHFRPYEPEQMLLLPPSLRDWVAPDHEIYFISDIVDRMDLRAVLPTTMIHAAARRTARG